MTGQAEGRRAFVFLKDQVGDCGVMGLVAGKARNGRGVLAKDEVGTGDRMSLDGVIEFVSFVEVEIEPRIHFTERDSGAPRKSKGARLAIDLHEIANVASHADLLRRRVELRGEIAGVRRMAEDAVALFVSGVLDGVR